MDFTSPPSKSQRQARNPQSFMKSIADVAWIHLLSLEGLAMGAQLRIDQSMVVKRTSWHIHSNP